MSPNRGEEIKINEGLKFKKKIIVITEPNVEPKDKGGERDVLVGVPNVARGKGWLVLASQNGLKQA